MISNFSYLSGYTDTLPNALMIGATPLCFVIGALVRRRSRRFDAGRYPEQPASPVA
jgi:hypothetical protein